MDHVISIKILPTISNTCSLGNWEHALYAQGQGACNACYSTSEIYLGSGLCIICPEENYKYMYFRTFKTCYTCKYIIIF